METLLSVGWSAGEKLLAKGRHPRVQTKTQSRESLGGQLF